MSRIQFLDRVSSAYLALTGKASRVEVREPVNRVDEKKSRKSAVNNIEKRQVFRTSKDIRDFEIAVEELESPTYDREEIHEIYRQVTLEDLEVSGTWEKREMKILKKDFFIAREGEDEADKDMTRLFKKTWFNDFLKAALQQRPWGYVCIELLNWNREMMRFDPWRGKDGKMYDAVTVLDHDYVKPETGHVVADSSLIEGVDIFSLPNQLIFCGSKKHGFLYDVAKPTLFKQNTVANWSEFIEVFGIDALVAFSEAEGEQRKKLFDALNKLGSTKTAVMDIDDKIEAVGASNADVYQVFDKMLAYLDQAIAKKIFGQDVISNNTGQVVGNVGENVANDYVEADSKYLTYTVNDKLFPLMTRAGYLDLSGYEFRYDNTMSLREMKERSEVDLSISKMGFKHDPDQLNERYNVNVESQQTATIPEIEAKLKKLYPR